METETKKTKINPVRENSMEILYEYSYRKNKYLLPKEITDKIDKLPLYNLYWEKVNDETDEYKIFLQETPGRVHEGVDMLYDITFLPDEYKEEVKRLIGEDSIKFIEYDKISDNPPKGYYKDRYGSIVFAVKSDYMETFDLDFVKKVVIGRCRIDEVDKNKYTIVQNLKTKLFRSNSSYYILNPDISDDLCSKIGYDHIEEFVQIDKKYYSKPTVKTNKI